MFKFPSFEVAECLFSVHRFGVCYKPNHFPPLAKKEAFRGNDARDKRDFSSS